MLSVRNIIYVFVLLALTSGSLLSQKKGRYKLTEEEATHLREAEGYFKDENYSAAFESYEKLIATQPAVIEFRFKAGICCLYHVEQKEKSVEYFGQVLKEQPETPDIHFYLGRAYHLNERFDEAIEQLKIYLSEKPPAAKRLQTEALLENCENARIIVQMPVEVKITNIGDPINTRNSEYVPVISSDESVLMYTYKGERSKGGLLGFDGLPDIFGNYYEDVFISYKVGDKWLSPESIGDNINTTGHDACIALSSDGQKLFIFKSDVSDGGDIYVSNLDGNVWSSPERLKGGVNTRFWEGSASLSSDGKTLYFSSERPGGTGGRDIYRADLQADGSWGNIANLGASINTKSDDDAPFIHPDGKLFFFSSKGRKSIGGFDIFQSELQSDGAWSEPVNLGYPINTPNDDIYYVVSADGKRGYYSSGKGGGMGKQDIYIVEPAIYNKKIALAMIRGVVTLDLKPMKANILVSNVDNNQFVGDYTSNAATGKYLINLPTGNNYKLVYKLEGMEDQEKTINTSSVDSFMNAVMQVDFYTKEFLAAAKKQDSTDKPYPTDTSISSTAEPPEEFSYETILEKYGSYAFDSLFFRVQVAAYKTGENFKYESLLKIGNIERQKYRDGITRFTIGGYFKTLKEADAVLKQVKAEGAPDAFIVCFYKGQKIPVKSFISTIPKQE